MQKDAVKNPRLFIPQPLMLCSVNDIFYIYVQKLFISLYKYVYSEYWTVTDRDRERKNTSQQECTVMGVEPIVLLIKCHVRQWDSQSKPVRLQFLNAWISHRSLKSTVLLAAEKVSDASSSALLLHNGRIGKACQWRYVDEIYARECIV